MDSWRWCGIEKVIRPADLLAGIDYLLFELEDRIDEYGDILKVKDCNVYAKAMFDWYVAEYNAVLSIAQSLSLSYWVRKYHQHFFEHQVPEMNNAFCLDLIDEHYGEVEGLGDIRFEDMFDPAENILEYLWSGDPAYDAAYSQLLKLWGVKL